MISRTAEYALRAAVCLAAEPARPLTTPEIARLARVPAGYLAKVMQSMVRAGLVRSRRGKGGGFVLATDLAQMTLLSVISAVDPIRRLRGCPLGHPAHSSGLCPLHRSLDDVAASAEQALGASSIASLLQGEGRRVPLCLPESGGAGPAPTEVGPGLSRPRPRNPARP